MRQGTLFSLGAEIPTLSYSKLDSFLACPYRYQKEYLQKKLSMKSMSSNHYYFGLSIHQALSHSLCPGKDFSMRQFEKELKVAWHDGEYEDIKVSKKDFQDALRMIKHLSGTKYFKKRPKAVEPRFRVPVESAVLTGSIDRIDVHNGLVEVVDYKSGDKEKPVEDLKENFQWYFYYHGCRKVLGKYPKKMTFIYLDTGRVVSFSIERDDIAKAADQFGKAVDALLAEKEFKPKKNIWCINCRFDRECGLFAEN